MIESIRIADTATFDDQPELLSPLKQVNFVFGANGSGKTTISRVIEDVSSLPECDLGWRDGRELETLVYSRDYVERNYNQCSELKGIFTLGEKDIEISEKIKAAKTELDALTSEISGLRQTLEGTDGKSGKMAELAVLVDELKEKCWAQKRKHDDKLSGAFEGYRGSAEKFKDKVVSERASNTATATPLSELEQKAATVFGQNPTAEASVPVLDFSRLLGHAANPLLSKKVIGRDDVDIAAMIEKLGVSDWVKQGLPYYESNNRVCPFCQQETSDGFARSLAEYFDGAFDTDTRAIENLESSYRTDSQLVLQGIAAVLASPSAFLDSERLQAEADLLESKIKSNLQLIASKRREPSRVVTLEHLETVSSVVGTLVADANARIADHNHMVKNIAAEKADLTASVWRHVLDELQADLNRYTSRRSGLDKAIASLGQQIQTLKTRHAAKTVELRELEKLTTSIQPTIDGINSLLASFGFSSFSLDLEDGGTCYRLVRPNGTDAKDTLSEGEKTFVTFLYFFHSLKGSDTGSGTTVDRVVVFDDPVSSLDSDILFIVSSLIKTVFDEVRSGAGQIKQVFVLTHNVYFHKEITFDGRRSGGAAFSDETFWIVRREDCKSSVVRYESNPISTSYEMLWAEVRSPGGSCLTIQNTLRRILENYFKILGQMNAGTVCDRFEGKDRVICGSLFSWLNDGSHLAHDDLYVSIDETTVDRYLHVFREIFERLGHGEHYRMMMGDAYIERSTADTSAVVSKSDDRSPSLAGAE